MGEWEEPAGETVDDKAVYAFKRGPEDRYAGKADDGWSDALWAQRHRL